MDLSNDADQTLVIIGNGMVSHRLCQRMVEYNAVDDKRIVVFGEEPRPGYDRVHLTDLLTGTPSTKLLLANQDWYAHNGIELFLDDPVVEIDRVNGVVRSKSGRSIAYTRLVFATGSQPFVPPVDVISSEGETRPGMFVYRTIDDVYDIEDRADELLGTPLQNAAIIGGGILGLEAAKAVYDLGLDVHVIEVAPGLMPRQLDADGAAVLKEKIERLGVNVQCGRTLKSVESLPFRNSQIRIVPSRENPKSADKPLDAANLKGLTGLRLTFDKGDPLMVGMLVFAAGVRPRGELAAAAGLSTNELGGIIVDDRLQALDKATGKVDEQIHAIGDCAAHRGTSYGLVLPGYQMVDVLASNLVGGQQAFEVGDASVRLKLMGVTVSALGEHDGDKRPGSTATVFNGGGLYRKLIVRNGRLIGAVTIGDWENLERVRELLKSPLPLSFWDMRRFRGTGDLWAKSESAPVAEWAPAAVVCGCLRVTRGAIGQAITDGCATVEEVCAKTSAGTLCGSCKPLISELLGLDVPASMHGGTEGPQSQRDTVPLSRREGIRSRREVSRSRLDLEKVAREVVGSSMPRTGAPPGLSSSTRSTLISPTNQGNADDESAPMAGRSRAARPSEFPTAPLEPAPRTATTTGTELAAVLRTNSSPSPEVKPSPRSLAVLAALHGELGEEPAPRKDDPRPGKEDAKLRKEASVPRPAPRKEEPSARKDDARGARGPATPRAGTVPPPPAADAYKDEEVNSSRQLEAALPLIVSGAMPLSTDAAISTLTPAAGMVLGPALRAYAAAAAKVAEMDASPNKAPRTETPTPPTGIELAPQLSKNKGVERKAGSTPPTGIDPKPQLFGNKATERKAEATPATGIELGPQLLGNKAVVRKTESTPPTGMPVVARAAQPGKPLDAAPSSSSFRTPSAGMPAVEGTPSTRRPGGLRPKEPGSQRGGLSGTPASNVTVVETAPQPPRSRRGAPSVRVVSAEPISTRTPASGMMFDKSQLSADAYSQLSIPKSSPTGFELNALTRGKSDRPPSDQRTPAAGNVEPASGPASVRAKALQNRGGIGFASSRLSDPSGLTVGSQSDRAPQSVRRPNLVGGEEPAGGSSDPSNEPSRPRSRISLISTVDEAEIAQKLGRDSVLPGALDRAPVSRRTWVPPKNVTIPPGALTTTPPPQPVRAATQAPPAERGRKALLTASIVAVSWALVQILAPPIPVAKSMGASALLDAVTRTGAWRQVSGYALVAVCLLSLGISLRKRWKRFQFADVPFFRAVHGVVTAASLVLFFAHTGFRVGNGLNFILTIVFLGVMIIGAVAGAVFAFSDRWSALTARDRRLRAAWVHVLVVWPLPILIALHVIMVYYY